MRTNSKNWLGIILVILGALFLLDNYGLFWFNLHPLIFGWHTIFLIIGIVLVVNHKNSLIGYILIGIGLIDVLKHSFFFNIDFNDFWPLILLGLGLWLILSRRERQIIHAKFSIPGNEKTTIDSSVFDTIDEVCVFNNVHKTINSSNFKGGTITSIFGSVKLDLTSAKLAPGENNLEINNIFGSIKIRVPQGWKVLVNVSSIFGGFEDKRFGGLFKTEESQGILVIKGASIFGGGDLKY
jgi:predicted membrane protein